MSKIKGNGIMAKIEVENSYFESVNSPVFKELEALTLPVSVAYYLSLIIAELKFKAKVYFDAKNKIIMKYAATDDEGALVQVGDGIQLTQPAKFAQEFGELTALKTTLSQNKIKLNLQDLDEALKNGVSPQIMGLIAPLVDISDTPDAKRKGKK